MELQKYFYLMNYLFFHLSDMELVFLSYQLSIVSLISYGTSIFMLSTICFSLISYGTSIFILSTICFFHLSIMELQQYFYLINYLFFHLSVMEPQCSSVFVLSTIYCFPYQLWNQYFYLFNCLFFHLSVMELVFLSYFFTYQLWNYSSIFILSTICFFTNQLWNCSSIFIY